MKSKKRKKFHGSTTYSQYDRPPHQDGRTPTLKALKIVVSEGKVEQELS